MNPSNVYFTDFHTVAFGDSLPVKLKKLIRKAGIEKLDLEGKFVAIKMHFGELTPWSIWSAPGKMGSPL